MPEISKSVKFENIAREWRCKWRDDSDKNTLEELQATFEKINVDLSAVEGVSSVQRVVCGGCHDFKIITKLPVDKFHAWEKTNFAPEEQFLAAIKNIDGVSAVESQTYTLEEVKLNKKDLKKAQEKREQEEKKIEENATEKKVEDPNQKLKKVRKEGGKRGVEIEGAADMGGLQFFCTSVDEPNGDIDHLLESVKAMNAKSDPSEEERKGGSGHIGKMVFSAGTEQLAIVAYVPEAKKEDLKSDEWLEKVLSLFQGVMGQTKTDSDGSISTGSIKTNSDKGVFPLKIREALILEANNFLRKKGLFPEDDGDDDDEMVFGDDDFPS